MRVTQITDGEWSATVEGRVMGYERVEMRIVANLGRHNSVDDRIDQAIWEYIRDRVQDILQDERVRRISPEIV